jgi:hypothetical protein
MTEQWLPETPESKKPKRSAEQAHEQKNRKVTGKVEKNK